MLLTLTLIDDETFDLQKQARLQYKVHGAPFNRMAWVSQIKESGIWQIAVAGAFISPEWRGEYSTKEDAVKALEHELGSEGER